MKNGNLNLFFQQLITGFAVRVRDGSKLPK